MLIEVIEKDGSFSVFIDGTAADSFDMEIEATDCKKQLEMLTESELKEILKIYKGEQQ